MAYVLIDCTIYRYFAGRISQSALVSSTSHAHRNIAVGRMNRAVAILVCTHIRGIGVSVGVAGQGPYSWLSASSAGFSCDCLDHANAHPRVLVVARVMKLRNKNIRESTRAEAKLKNHLESERVSRPSKEKKLPHAIASARLQASAVRNLDLQLMQNSPSPPSPVAGNFPATSP